MLVATPGTVLVATPGTVLEATVELFSDVCKAPELAHTTPTTKTEMATAKNEELIIRELNLRMPSLYGQDVSPCSLGTQAH